MIDIRETREDIIDMDRLADMDRRVDMDHQIDVAALGQETNMEILNHGAEKTSLDLVEETIIVKEMIV
jgi:hypothetical protein